jgi:hypothetical protein
MLRRKHTFMSTLRSTSVKRIRIETRYCRLCEGSMAAAKGC